MIPFGANVPPEVLRDLMEELRDVELAVHSAKLLKLPPGLPAVMAQKRPRDSGWRAVREHFLKCYPECQACGGTEDLDVHHMVPFHIDPNLELVESNLITLCRSGPGGMNCHYVLGHGGHSWADYISTPKVLITYMRNCIRQRIRG